MKKIYKRTGDHNFYQVDEIPKGEIVKHNGRFVYGVGEASNHCHIITMKKPEDLEIVKDKNGNYYFSLVSEGVLTHEIGDSRQEADHKPIVLPAGKYTQVHERELDLFQNVVRRVQD